MKIPRTMLKSEDEKKEQKSKSKMNKKQLKAFRKEEKSEGESY